MGHDWATGYVTAQPEARRPVPSTPAAKAGAEPPYRGGLPDRVFHVAEPMVTHLQKWDPGLALSGTIRAVSERMFVFNSQEAVMAAKSTTKPKVDAKLVERVLKLRRAGKTWNEVRESLKMPTLRGEHVRAWLKEHDRAGEAARPANTPESTEAQS